MSAPHFVKAGGSAPAGGKATASLVVGIASIALCVLSIGLLAVLTLPAGIVAIVLGAQARRHTSSGHAQGGIITGSIGAVLSVLALLFWVVIIATGAIALEFLSFWEGLDETLQIPDTEDPINPDADIS